MTYQLGTIVVYRDFYIDELLKVDLIIDENTVGYRGAKRHFMYFQGCANINTLRPAEKAEIKLGRRIDKVEGGSDE
ncbi:hypothetical protein [Acinetobacter beijerinckii]|uniref:hypothetical protein n=1 Tax=Acinetobacter beijerinckii TaxID=262668 RepID=UPI004054A5EE